MAARLTVLPPERFTALRPSIEAQTQTLASMIVDEKFPDFFDPSLRAMLVESFRQMGADEGTIWLLDEDRQHLVPRYNSGPNANTFVGTFRQSLREGMISMVVATEQPICENEMPKNRRQDRRLDEQLQLQTVAMLAVPFYFAREMRGVISCVQLEPAGSTKVRSGFSHEHLQALQLSAGVLSRLIDYRLLSLCLGLEGLG
jgi:transcriptional regulator with GAF, ATPase, and Fis domain